MKKQKIKSEVQEITLNPIETALQTAGKSISKEHLNKMFIETDKLQKRFVTRAVLTGIAAHAVKLTLPHGEFKDWLYEAIIGNSKSCTRATFAKAGSYHTVNRWKKIAEYIVGQIHKPHDNSPVGQRVIEYAKKNENPSENFSLYINNENSLTKLIDFVTAGLSMRQLATIFQDANSDANDEEEAEAKTIDEDGKPVFKLGKKPDKADDPQLKLWEDWTEELSSIDSLLKDTEIMNLEPHHWEAIENKLAIQLAEVRKITRNIKKGK